MAKHKGKAGRALVKASASALDYQGLVAAIGEAHETAQRRALQAINVALTLRNWLIGYYIVEYEQQGSDRAEYGAQLLESLARDLPRRLGRGFGQRNLFTFRQFYLRYPSLQSLIAKFALTLPYPSAVAAGSSFCVADEAKS